MKSQMTWMFMSYLQKYPWQRHWFSRGWHSSHQFYGKVNFKITHIKWTYQHEYKLATPWGLVLVSWWSNCRKGRRWKRITNKSFQDDQLEDLMVNETNMVDLLPLKELRNGHGTGENEHSSCNNNPPTNNGKPIAMAPIT